MRRFIKFEICETLGIQNVSNLGFKTSFGFRISDFGFFLRGFDPLFFSVALFAAVAATPCCFADDEPEAKPVVDPQKAATERKELSERILEHTKAARDKLAEKITDADTKSLQDGVVRDLERLIELLRHSPPPSGGGSSSPPPPNSDQSSDPSQQQQQQNSQDQQNSSERESSQGNGSGKNREQPTDSEERSGETPEMKALADRRRRLESDIWGHLPPALRERLLNTYGDRMLPQYEDFVRKFYEALSEPKRTKP